MASKLSILVSRSGQTYSLVYVPSVAKRRCRHTARLMRHAGRHFLQCSLLFHMVLFHQEEEENIARNPLVTSQDKGSVEPNKM
eukprot:2175181-Amphidinium_carterae.2